MFSSSIHSQYSSYSESHYSSRSNHRSDHVSREHHLPKELQSSKDLDQQPISTHEVEDSEAVSRASNFDVDALVNQIWDFASARIATAEAGGASESELDDMWKAAEKGVSQGFGEAKDILEDMGQLDEALGYKIDTAYGEIMDKLGDRSTAKEPNMAEVNLPKVQKAPDRLVEIQQYERQTFSLNLRTNEGDKIQIRSVVESSSSLEDSRFGNKSSTVWGNQQSSGFELIIKGDLNDQERSDLDTLLAEINDLAYEFYEGDYETAFNMAQELNIDGSSLKSMRLSMTEVEQKAASVYSEAAEKPTVLPKGLTSLREYADKLIAAQNKWASNFNSPDSFLESLSNHPKNHGSLEYVSKLLMS